MVGSQFHSGLDDVEQSLGEYRGQLEHETQAGSPIADNQHEWGMVSKIEGLLSRIRDASRSQDWVLDNDKVEQLASDLESLHALSGDLPTHLYDKIHGFAREVRAQYRTLIVGTWLTSVSAAIVLAVLLKLFYNWVVQPLRILIAGSRQVAAGQFHYRIHLETDDEMAELAEAMNDMTDRFQAIRDDLDRQVQERTKQVVRSEQLASVGFLAAGVAHEINNPLASIAMCGESLESRLREVLDGAEDRHGVVFQLPAHDPERGLPLQGDHREALGLLPHRPDQTPGRRAGRTGAGGDRDARPPGQVPAREIRLHCSGPVIAPVNPQEIKQVVLNLLTNALDSLEENGSVQVEVRRSDAAAELTVTDNGCGMTPEVLEHVFEPFFTRRKEGQGTGLGLSISYRIVADHGGQLEAQSPGPGQGATFRVRLPLQRDRQGGQAFLPVTGEPPLPPRRVND